MNKELSNMGGGRAPGNDELEEDLILEDLVDPDDEEEEGSSRLVDLDPDDDDEDEDEDEDGEEAPEEEPEETPEETVESQVDPEQFEADYKQAQAQATETTILHFKDRAVALDAEIREVEGQINSILWSCSKEANGGLARNPNAFETRMLANLEQRRASLDVQDNQLRTDFETAKRENQYKTHVDMNIKAFPELAPYKAEFLAATKKGFRFDTVDEAVSVLKAMRVKNGGKPVKTLTSAEIRRQAIENQIGNKRKGAITGGKGAAGTRDTAGASRQNATESKFYSTFAGLGLKVPGAKSGKSGARK